MPESPVDLGGSGKRFAIVASQFNGAITERLLVGAKQALTEHAVPDSSIDVTWVPGAFEIPLVAKTLAATGSYQAVICLGAVIRGETSHFEHVGREATAGIASVALDTGIPVLLGVLTTETVEQALDRSGGKAGNKGYDASLAALEMANLMERLAARGRR